MITLRARALWCYIIGTVLVASALGWAQAGGANPTLGPTDLFGIWAGVGLVLLVVFGPYLSKD